MILDHPANAGWARPWLWKTARSLRSRATVLGSVKGWVLAVLAMLAPEAGRCAWLRAAAVPAPSGAALDRPCAPCRPERVGTRNVPHFRPNGLRPGPNKELVFGKKRVGESEASWRAALILDSVSPLYQ